VLVFRNSQVLVAHRDVEIEYRFLVKKWSRNGQVFGAVRVAELKRSQIFAFGELSMVTWTKAVQVEI
jgi:hypothetical protein